MKYLVSLFAWTCGSLTLALGLPLVILSLVFSNFRIRTKICQCSLRIFTAAFLVRVQLFDREKVDLTNSNLFMANHASFLDFFILGGYLPGELRGIEAGEHFSWPFWGWFLKKADMVPIDRSSPRASLTSIGAAADCLKKGISILILPESTRTRDGRMLPFKKLPFKLAKKGGTDLVPVGLIGTFDVKPKTRWHIKPGVVEIHFGKTIPAAQVASDTIPDLMETTRKRIADLIGEKEE
jgi:1-acyl-sn-glycerol-3-phosphate acyltransferase